MTVYSRTESLSRDECRPECGTELNKWVSMDGKFLFHVQKPITVHCMEITVHTIFLVDENPLTTSVWMT